jgi:hypothetical protein
MVASAAKLLAPQHCCKTMQVDFAALAGHTTFP